MNNNFKSRLIKAMSIRNIKAADLSRKSGLSKSLISKYIKGEFKAKQTTLTKLAIALDVSEAWLMGCDVPMSRPDEISTIDKLNAMNLLQLNFANGASDIVQLYQALNDEGRDKALDYLNDLNKLKEYKKKD